MRNICSLFAMFALAVPAFGQPNAPSSPNAPATLAEPPTTNPISPIDAQYGDAPSIDFTAGSGGLSSRLKGDTEFPNFIGFISDPTLAIDPRALTQIWPVFADVFNTGSRFIPSGATQVYGPGLSVALSDRLEVGFNNGGYVYTTLGKDRQGFLNVGGFAQYSLIRDVEDQFILSSGLQWKAPWGSYEIFQGKGPVYLTPYFTFGKEFGDFHVLGAAGYIFPTSDSKITTQTFYASLHFDRRVCSWFYPVVEFNGAWNTRNVNLSQGVALPEFFDLDEHFADGSLVTVAPGFNIVLVQNRLELGATYETPIYSEHNLHFNELLVKMIFRY